MILTPEIVEKAARAGFAAFCKGANSERADAIWALDGDVRADFTAQVRAALEAVLPDVVEAHGKELDALGNEIVALRQELEHATSILEAK